MEMSYKVLLLEDNLVDACQMREIIEEEGYEVVGPATNCIVAYDLFTDHLPDLVICCIYLDCGDVAINFVEEALEINDVPVIYVSAYDDEETLNRALDSSPASYITKPFTAKQLLVAIKCALRKCHCKQAANGYGLPTDREMEIIRQLARGKSTKEIANELCVSYETIKSHRKNIYRKFRISSGAEAVAMAYQHNWLS